MGRRCSIVWFTGDGWEEDVALCGLQETGGKKMYHVPHSPVSIFHSDTQGSSRHGDVLVLLEDFVDQQSALSHASRDTS